MQFVVVRETYGSKKRRLGSCCTGKNQHLDILCKQTGNVESYSYILLVAYTFHICIVGEHNDTSLEIYFMSLYKYSYSNYIYSYSSYIQLYYSYGTEDNLIRACFFL